MACGNNHVSREYLSTQPQKASSAARVLEKTRLPVVNVDGRGERQAHQSRARVTAEGAETIDYFIGPDGNQTHVPDLHIHVIHNPNGDVTMEITNRRDKTRSSKLELQQPDGNEVRRAEQALAEILRTL